MEEGAGVLVRLAGAVAEARVVKLRPAVVDPLLEAAAVRPVRLLLLLAARRHPFLPEPPALWEGLAAVALPALARRVVAAAGLAVPST